MVVKVKIYKIKGGDFFFFTHDNKYMLKSMSSDDFDLMKENK